MPSRTTHLRHASGRGVHALLDTERRPPRFRELRLRLPPPAHWLGEVRDRWQAHARLVRCRPVACERPRIERLVEIEAAPEDAAPLRPFLNHWLPPGAVWEPVDRSGAFLVWTSEPLGETCRFVQRLGGVCLTCPLASPRAEDGRIDWRLLIRVGDRSVNRALRSQSAGALGLRGATVEAIGRYVHRSNLSSKQDRAVATAFHLGYFDLPRRADLRSIARALGVRPSTAQEHIRRGVAKIVARVE